MAYYMGMENKQTDPDKDIRKAAVWAIIKEILGTDYTNTQIHNTIWAHMHECGMSGQELRDYVLNLIQKGSIRKTFGDAVRGASAAVVYVVGNDGSVKKLTNGRQCISSDAPTTPSWGHFEIARISVEFQRAVFALPLSKVVELEQVPIQKDKIREAVESLGVKFSDEVDSGMVNAMFRNTLSVYRGVEEKAKNKIVKDFRKVEMSHAKDKADEFDIEDRKNRDAVYEEARGKIAEFAKALKKRELTEEESATVYKTDGTLVHPPGPNSALSTEGRPIQVLSSKKHADLLKVLEKFSPIGKQVLDPGEPLPTARTIHRDLNSKPDQNPHRNKSRNKRRRMRHVAASPIWYVVPIEKGYVLVDGRGWLHHVRRFFRNDTITPKSLLGYLSSNGSILRYSTNGDRISLVTCLKTGTVPITTTKVFSAGKKGAESIKQKETVVVGCDIGVNVLMSCAVVDSAGTELDRFLVCPREGAAHGQDVLKVGLEMPGEGSVSDGDVLKYIGNRVDEAEELLKNQATKIVSESDQEALLAWRNNLPKATIQGIIAAVGERFAPQLWAMATPGTILSWDYISTVTKMVVKNTSETVDGKEVRGLEVVPWKEGTKATGLRKWIGVGRPKMPKHLEEVAEKIEEEYHRLQKTDPTYRKLTLYRLQVGRRIVNAVRDRVRMVANGRSVVFAKEDLDTRSKIFDGGGHTYPTWDSYFKPKNDRRWYKMLSLSARIDELATHDGETVIKVNPAYTSQRCRGCGHVDKSNRDGVKFACVKCGYEDHADLVGALNVAQVAIDGKSIKSPKKGT